MPKLTERHGAERLVEECKQATSQESLVLDASQEFGLDLSDPDVDAVCEAINGNSRIQTLRFSPNVTVSPSAAYKVVDTFIPHPTLKKLEFKPYGNVSSPGQGPLMRMLDEFPESVAAHNEMVDSLERKYDEVAALLANPRPRKRSGSAISNAASTTAASSVTPVSVQDSKGASADKPRSDTPIPSHLLDAVLKPFVVSGSPKKRLNLGE